MIWGLVTLKFKISSSRFFRIFKSDQPAVFDSSLQLSCDYNRQFYLRFTFNAAIPGRSADSAAAGTHRGVSKKMIIKAFIRLVMDGRRLADLSSHYEPRRTPINPRKPLSIHHRLEVTAHR